MPIYEYICNNCKEKFSLLQSIHDYHKETTCPSCGSNDVNKLISSFATSSSASGCGSHAHSCGGGGGG